MKTFEKWTNYEYNDNTDLDWEINRYLKNSEKFTKKDGTIFKINKIERKNLEKILNNNIGNEKEIAKNTSKENLEKLKSEMIISSATKNLRERINNIINIKEWKESINTKNYNSVLWWNKKEYKPGISEKKAELEFRRTYWELSNQISEQIWIPKWLNIAITRKETQYWLWKLKNNKRQLNSWTWSKWIMQLTRWPFLDMEWQTKEKKISHSKIRSYRSIFQNIDLNKIKEIQIWEWKKIWDTLSNELWNDLYKASSKDITNIEFSKIIKKFRKVIKSPKNKYKYFHTLNIIIWSVYLSKIYSRTKSIEETAMNYNGDNKYHNGRKVKYWYSKKVLKYYNEEISRK